MSEQLDILSRIVQNLLHDMERGLWTGEVAIVGAYEAPYRSAPGVHPFAIHAECVAGALADAGLEFGDVDGFATAASFPPEGAREMAMAEVAEYVGLRPRWFDGTDIGGAAPIAHAGHAAMAIVTGMADVVVVSYAASGRSWPHGSDDYLTYASGPGQWEIPYGPTTVATYALAARRHMHEFGTTPEQLAQIAVQCRANAASNEHARYRDAITIEDVTGSPVIASPLHRLDCCVVSDSGAAFVLTSRRRADSLGSVKPVYLLGFGEALGQVSMSQMPDFTATAGVASGAAAFATAGLTADEIDCAQLYDSFTITALLALEDLGFCAKGDGGRFVAGGGIAPGGPLPINTDGGGLSSNHPGRRGAIAVVEAVRQLQGRSPGVRLDGARTCLVHGVGGSLSATATIVLAT
jgi:acetyl-CoA C-acetyltransferase